jgi:hypothetical protein
MSVVAALLPKTTVHVHDCVDAEVAGADADEGVAGVKGFGRVTVSCGAGIARAAVMKRMVVKC